MQQQRPVSPWNVGAVACLALVAALATGCGEGTVEVDAPPLSGSDAQACATLVEALPDAVSDQPVRSIESDDGYAAAWGDPAIVLRCGVPAPEGFDEFASCHVANGVGWFVPEDQVGNQDADVVMTTIGFEQNVEVVVPARYRPPAAVMVDLAAPINQSIREPDPCV